jgi:hypothetical protein
MCTRLRSQLSVVALAVVATACGSDSSVAPNTPPATLATLEQALTELTLPALSAVGSSVSGLFPEGPVLGTGSCAYTAESQSFVCTPATAGGVTIEQSFTLLTASGATQSAFDQATTASVTTNTSVTGTEVDESSTITIDGQEELTLSGLLTGPHTLNGSSHVHLAGTFDDGTTNVPLDITVTSSITNVVLPANTTLGAQIWPTSGTIVVESSGSFADLPPSTSRLTMTFNGTSTVTVTITESGVSQTCKQDLAKPETGCV